MQFLFVGGPVDRQRHEVKQVNGDEGFPNKIYIRSIAPKKKDKTDPDRSDIVIPSQELSEYRLRWICEHGVMVHPVGVYVSIEIKDIVACLLTNYNKYSC